MLRATVCSGLYWGLLFIETIVLLTLGRAWALILPSRLYGLGRAKLQEHELKLLDWRHCKLNPHDLKYQESNSHQKLAVVSERPHKSPMLLGTVKLRV